MNTNTYLLDIIYHSKLDVSPKSKQTKVQLITNLSAVKSEPKQKQNIEEENGEKEYTLCLKKALNEAITENDYVSVKHIYIMICMQFREEVERLKKENEELKQQIEDRDNAIVELVACYDVSLLYIYVYNVFYYNSIVNFII